MLDDCRMAGSACRLSTIESVHVHYGQIPVKVRFSYGAPSVFDFLIVRIRAGEHEGIGETLMKPFKEIDQLTQWLVGKDARCLDALIGSWESKPYRSFGEAVSMALYDLMGKISGLPFWALLGGKKRDEVPLMPCIFPESPREAATLAEKFVSQGVRYLKTKLVGDLDEDRGRIKAIRSVAPDIILQADANEGYKTLADAIRAVDSLGEAGLDLFEDPLKGGVQEYRRLTEKNNSRAKIMVDVLARRIEDLTEVLRNNAAQVVNLHPCQMGSMTSALRHVALANAFDVPVVLAGTGYAGVGTAAWQHLTAAASNQSPSGELGGAVDHGMPESLVYHTLTDNVHSVRIPDVPGLGVTLDLDSLKRYERESWYHECLNA